MNREFFEKLVSERFDTPLDRPFESDQSIVVFRHESNRRWFAVVMTIPKRLLGMHEDGKIDIVNVKCAQEIIDSMWQEDGIYPAYHMSKAHWLTLALDGRVSTDTLEWLLDISYDLTRTKIAKRKSSK